MLMATQTAWANLQQKHLTFPESLLRATHGLGSEQAPANVSSSLFLRGRYAPRVTRAHGARRQAEIRWRESHDDVLRRYIGEWIALEGERIVSHGNDLSRVIADARAAGVVVPYVFRIEDNPADVIPIGL